MKNLKNINNMIARGVNTEIGMTIIFGNEIVTLTEVLWESKKIICYKTKGECKRIGEYTSTANVNKTRNYKVL
jgi:hypothetical protein